MSKLILEIPNHRLADPNKFTHPDPNKQSKVGTLREEYVDFGIVRLAPDTLIGKERHVVTTHFKFEEYCQFTGRDFIDWCKELTLIHGCTFKQLMFIIKVSNSEFNQPVPEGIIGAYGIGEGIDAQPNELRTWLQWNKYAQQLGGDGGPIYSDNTHKYLVCWTYSGLPQLGLAEYTAFFSHLDTINDKTKYDIISITEYNQILPDQL